MAEQSSLPILYGVDKNGKNKMWKIEVEKCEDHSVIKLCYGAIDGKKVECIQKVDRGNNINKKNEKSHYERALSLAQSKWNKKKDTDGYTEQRSDKKLTPTQSTPVQDGSQPVQTLLPMLAQDYKKHSKKVKFPCYIQPKLDGYRMVYNCKTGSITTRTGRDYVSLLDTDLYKELKDIPYNLDGELYVHDPTFSFENYGVLRKTKIGKDDRRVLETIKYHVYDVIDFNKTFKERDEILMKLKETHQYKNILFVQREVCSNVIDVEKYHQLFVEDNYEGSMVRNVNGLYKCKYRSYDLLKKKDFDDDEFTIIGYTSEKETGKNEKEGVPLVVWICETDDHKIFNVRPKGVEDERNQLFLKGQEYIGKRLWTKFFGYTENSVPRFPTTARDTFKEYIRETKM
uniref:Polydeoxyribonucleotide synthase [ATP] n=1 Tax=viral metagenome TaxID=1070528 RepID=A0A6C0DZ64_9ZZZZ